MKIVGFVWDFLKVLIACYLAAFQKNLHKLAEAAYFEIPFHVKIDLAQFLYLDNVHFPVFGLENVIKFFPELRVRLICQRQFQGVGTGVRYWPSSTSLKVGEINLPRMKQYQIGARNETQERRQHSCIKPFD